MRTRGGQKGTRMSGARYNQWSCQELRNGLVSAAAFMPPLEHLPDGVPLTGATFPRATRQAHIGPSDASATACRAFMSGAWAARCARQTLTFLRVSKSR